MTTPPPPVAATETLPVERPDLRPLWLVPAVAACALPLIGSTSTWITLTFAGLAMGMIVFVMASGLTLVFGLMRILNLGHGVFVSVGAFAATTALGWMTGLSGSRELAPNLAALVPTMLLAMALAAGLGWMFERLIIRPVAGQPLKLILTTMGGLSIGQELIKVVWGPDPIPIALPASLQGSLILGDAVIDKYRLLAAACGLLVFLAITWTLDRTKIGLLIRAGVHSREMVESFGYRIRGLFLAVFLAGCALAALGGVMWGLYQGNVDAQMGSSTLVLAIIVIIIGGLGSTGGCFIGALLVGIFSNYAGFLVPKLTLVSDILLMVAIVLWRPEGLYPVVKH